MYVCINASVVVIQVGVYVTGEMRRIWSTSGAHVGSTAVAIPVLAPRLILLLLHLLLLLAGPSATVVLAAPVSLVPLNLPQGKKKKKKKTLNEPIRSSLF